MAAASTLAAQPAAQPVAYDVFCQVDLRIGRILYATPVAGSRQGLCQITVEVEGWGIGTAMSKVPGIKPRTLAGKLVVVGTNIQPRVIAGIVATVLLVTTRTPDQQQSSLVVPADPAIDSGCLVR